MPQDPKRELLRHLVATVVFRGNVAVRDAPPDFAEFKLSEDTRTPAEVLAHIGDLMRGSTFLLRGEMRHLNSAPLAWDEEVARFFDTANQLDEFLASDAEITLEIEKLVQGPIADALTHIGQIVMLRRAAGTPVRGEPYFMADIKAGNI